MEVDKRFSIEGKKKGCKEESKENTRDRPSFDM